METWLIVLLSVVGIILIGMVLLVVVVNRVCDVVFGVARLDHLRERRAWWKRER